MGTRGFYCARSTGRSGSSTPSHRRWVVAGVVAVLALTAAGWATASSYVGYSSIVRANLSPLGVEANGASMAGGISDDGRLVAFHSEADNLVAGDTPSSEDVFVRNLETRQTVRVSVSSTGLAGDGSSHYADISADGRRVSYYSAATNLVPGDDNGVNDVFVRDLASNTTTLASVSTTGVLGNGSSYEAHMSATGRYVAFESEASNLVSGDMNGQGDAFVRDLEKGTTTRISVAWNEAEANGTAWYPVISADGRYAAFYSDSSNLIPGVTPPGTYQLYIRDLKLGSTYMASVSPTNTPGNGDSYEPRITPDGRHVVFYSWASNLVPGDTNGMADVFVRDLVSNETTLVSVSSAGVQGNQSCSKAAVSSDGEHVVFESEATNLVGDDTNDKRDIFARDLASGLTARLSASAAGVQGNNASERPGVSADGRYVTFSSDAASLVASDTNGKPDVFVWDRAKASSALTATSVSKTLPKYGARYSFSGRLVSGATPLRGKRVVLQKAESPSGPWASTSISAITAADGTFKMSAMPRSKTYYRARFTDAGWGWAESTSAAIAVTPRASVGTPKAPSTMAKGKARTVYGYLKPQHKKGTYPVRIYKWRKVAGKWKRYGYVKAEASDHKSYTKYAVRMKLKRKGTWRLRAYHPADSGHASGWSSKYDYVNVR